MGFIAQSFRNIFPNMSSFKQKNYKSCKATGKYDPYIIEKAGTETDLKGPDVRFNKDFKQHYKFVQRTKGSYTLESKRRYDDNVLSNIEYRLRDKN